MPSFFLRYKNHFISLCKGMILVILGYSLALFFPPELDSPLVSPFATPPSPAKELPFLQYTIPHLQSRRYAPSSITLEEKISENEDFLVFLFSYTPGGKKITGQLNIPRSAFTAEAPKPVIVLVRGYVPLAGYTTGTGTRNAASVFARNGYITLAPDFLGYGESDPELENSWEARFIKPIQLIELLTTIRSQKTLNFTSPTQNLTAQMDGSRLGIWAHSNGGQITLTALEIMQESLPTTLWAPVSVPFPYSVLFYTDEMEDEGRATRLWLSEFEKNYDPREFSLTQYLSSLKGPLQLHHGTSDEAALKTWSDELKQKIDVTNTTKKEKGEASIELTYFIYQGADHNMVPVWDTVIQRDLQFFTRTLGKK